MSVSQNLPQGNISPHGDIAMKLSWQFFENMHPLVRRFLGRNAHAISRNVDSIIWFFLSKNHRSNSSIDIRAYSIGVNESSLRSLASPDKNRGLNLKFSLWSHTNRYSSGIRLLNAEPATIIAPILSPASRHLYRFSMMVS